VEVRPGRAWNGRGKGDFGDDTAPLYCRSFVDREAEMSALLELSARAAGGSGAVVLLSGEPGIGKSRLIDELAGRLSGRMQVFSACCLEYAPAPLEPVREVLGAQRPWLLSFADDATDGDLERLMDHRPLATAGASDEQASRKRRLFRGIFAAFAHVARATPFVAVFEDVQFADTATLEALRYVSQDLASVPALLILSYRARTANAAAATSSLLRALERLPHVHRIELSAMAPASTQRLLELTLPPGADVSRRRLLEIGARSEGNPLFAEELLKASLDIAAEPSRAFVLPASIETLLVERIRSLDDADAEFLETAAFLGRTFDASILCGVLAAPAERVIRFLRGAIERNLIVERDEPIDHFTFRHALVREFAIGRVIAMQARSLHERIATYLCGLADASERVPEIAYHYWSARLPERCRPYALDAAERFAQMHAYREALEQYRRVIACAPDASDAADIHERSGYVCVALDALPKAIEHFRVALDAVSAAQNLSRHVAIATEMAHALRRIGATDRSLALLESVRKLVTADTALLASVDASIAHAYCALEDFAAAEPYLAAATANVALLSERDRFRLLTSSSLERFAQGDLSGWRAATSAAIDVARSSGDPRLLGLALMERALQSRRIAEFDAALSYYRDALEIDGIGLTTYMRFLIADVLVAAGNVREAREEFDRAAGSDLSDVNLQIMAAYLALKFAVLYDDDALLAHVPLGILEAAYATKQPPSFVLLAAAFAEHHLARGRANEAQQEVMRAAASLPANYNEPETILTFVACGDRDVARQARVILENASIGGLRTVGDAFLDLADAYDARRSGSPSRVRRLAARAALAFHRLAMPLLEAEAAELAGRVRESRAVCDRVGIARLPRVRTITGSSAKTSSLTSRESEIVELLVLRLSNRTVAERLSISERTVETHVNAIFRKLAIRSREELRAAPEGARDILPTVRPR